MFALNDISIAYNIKSNTSGLLRKVDYVDYRLRPCFEVKMSKNAWSMHVELTLEPELAQLVEARALPGEREEDTIIRLLKGIGSARKPGRPDSPKYLPMYSLEPDQTVLIPYEFRHNVVGAVNHEAIRHAVARARKRTGFVLECRYIGLGVEVTRVG